MAKFMYIFFAVAACVMYFREGPGPSVDYFAMLFSIWLAADWLNEQRNKDAKGSEYRKNTKKMRWY